MVVKFFIGDEPEYEHEWKQFKEVYYRISKKYGNSNEVLYLLYNFRVSNRQIDVLILTENAIVILDLKAFQGEIIGNENGDWKVKTNSGTEQPLKTNLFRQLQSQKFALLEKLNKIRMGNFEDVEEHNLAKIKCWGYFNKGSHYDNEQLGGNVRIWFDVITESNLLEKMKFIDAGYHFRPKDMDAIVNGLNLKESSIEEVSSAENQVFESNYRKELSVFVPSGNYDEIKKKIFASNIVVIVGDPRVGKTTTTVNIAKELKNEGYEVRENVDSLIRLYYSKDKKDLKNLIHRRNVFIIDDVFGSTEYESSLGNTWVPILKKLLNSLNIKSKFVFTSRTDIFDKFLDSNKELSYSGLEEDLINSVVTIKVSDYGEEKRKEIFDKNIEFIQIHEENKKSSLVENNKKIITELVLPGEIWNILENVKDGDYGIVDIDNEIRKAKRQVNFIKEKIKVLENHKKIFLYNIYINKNFSYDDLERIYYHCLTFNNSERDYFLDCIEEFKDKYIIIKKGDDVFYPIKQGVYGYVNKIEFVHPIYIEAIEKLFKSDKKERNRIENILLKFNEVVRLKNIEGWESTSSKYDYIQLNAYLIAIRNYDIFTIQIKDLVIENLESLSFEYNSFLEKFFLESNFLFENDLELEQIEFEDDPNFSNISMDEDVKYFKEIFINYDKFDDDFKRYINKLFHMYWSQKNIANCFTYLGHNTIIKFQDRLKLLRNKEIDFLIAKCIIKNYEYLNEDNKLLFFNLDIRYTLLLLINNYNVLHADLKNFLMNKISELDKLQLIETGKTFLINYSFLPQIIRQKYDIMFDLENKEVIKQVGRALTEWFMEAFTQFYIEKHESVDEKVLELYCNWLENEKIVQDEKLLHENYYSFSDLYGDVGMQGRMQGRIESSIIDYNYLNLNKPKWTEPFYSKFKCALINNMMMLLNSFPSNNDEFPTYKEKTNIYITAFLFYSWCKNIELIKRVDNILYETDEIKYIFLEECLNFSIDNIQKPFELSTIQIELIGKLSKPPNHIEIRIKAKKMLNYINDLIDKKIIKIAKDDYC